MITGMKHRNYKSFTYSNRSCEICGNVFTPKHSSNSTCSEQCYIKSHVIDYSDPNKCWIWKANEHQPQNYGEANFNKVWCLAHRLSYQAFKGPLSNGDRKIQICHKCDIPACINPNHLVQSTAKNNNQHKIARNRDQNLKGENNNATKLTNEQVLAIFKTEGTNQQLANQFQTSPWIVSNIKLGVTWNSVTGMPHRRIRKRITESPLDDL